MISNRWNPSSKSLLIRAKDAWICLLGYKFEMIGASELNNNILAQFWEITSRLSHITSLRFYNDKCIFVVGICSKIERDAIIQSNELHTKINKIILKKSQNNFKISKLTGYSLEAILDTNLFNFSCSNRSELIKYKNKYFRYLCLHSIEFQGNFTNSLMRLIAIKNVFLIIGSEKIKSSIHQYFTILIHCTSQMELEIQQNKIVNYLSLDENINGKIELINQDNVARNPGKIALGIHNKKIGDYQILLLIKKIQQCLSSQEKPRNKIIYPWLGFNNDKLTSHENSFENNIIADYHIYSNSSKISSQSKVINFQMGIHSDVTSSENQLNLISKDINSYSVYNSNYHTKNMTIFEKTVNVLNKMGWLDFSIEKISNFKCHKITHKLSKLAIELFVFQEIPKTPPSFLFANVKSDFNFERISLAIIYEGDCPNEWKNNAWDMIEINDFLNFMIHAN